MSTNEIQIRGLEYGYPATGPILQIDELKITHGERVFIEGPSGSGKTTLLSLITGLASPQQGEIQIGEIEMASLKAVERDRFRADRIGLIYQMFNLIPYLTSIQNVTLAADLSRQRLDNALQQSGSVSEEAARLLNQLDITGQMHHRLPSALSVGQQQRVAAARAFMGAPGIIVADEPTSALDVSAARQFMHALLELAADTSATVLLVSHDHALAQEFDRTVNLTHLNGASACA